METESEGLSRISDDEESCPSSVAFTEALMGQIKGADVGAMVELQRDMLSRYEKTNEMLINFNMLSSSRFDATSQAFRAHTLLLYDMKKDLDVVFRRIRTLKQRLTCSDVYNVLEDEEEEFKGQNNEETKEEKDENDSAEDNG
ncbi:kxDL motif-containing protein CG10681-like isoform X2 [Pecten maximus]|uniref:kxDL motif-containing protein CG10681-like isoform X2 n=1 Tax=Pecten maximus TaxID=6579 RepID=UPI001457F34A|nr:kxDL motif-containing protein CG10681-like isoform X2 [Pecten maximus]